MAGWKKHFTRVDVPGNTGNARTSRWQSWLPEVYSGQPNRVERYTQYDQMDQDSEINAALDTIAEFCTQEDDGSKTPFVIKYKEDPTESESGALDTALNQWNNINDFDRRIFGIFRSAIKYGDQFFIRDPETYILYWVNPEDVMKAIVNESNGKEIDQYILKNVMINLQDKVVVDTKNLQDTSTTMTTPSNKFGNNAGNITGNLGNQEFAVDASNIVHVSLSDGLNNAWPFGQSILDSVFKVYKQKELLEDSIIIYRVQRAPERRVFYIDVGNMPAHKAMAFIERTKNEVHQTRIPNKSGGGTNVMDAAYNPLSIMEDYFFAQTAEGRGSKVEVLPGGDNLGEIDDLRYFNNKLMRGLRVPSSYLPTGSDDGTATYQDGRVGTALIQEYRFAKYCERLQNTMQTHFDKEFKMFLKHRGINIPSNLFSIQLTESQNFASYREMELDSQRVTMFGGVEGVQYLSRRFILKKYLGLTEDEIVENEINWREENTDSSLQNNAKRDLGGVGIRTGDIEGFEPTDVDAENDADTDMGGTDVDSPVGGPASSDAGGGEGNEI
jgi:hypothetical protein